MSRLYPPPHHSSDVVLWFSKMLPVGETSKGVHGISAFSTTAHETIVIAK